MHSTKFVLLVVAIGIGGGLLLGQTGSGGISGIVLDQTKSVLPGATLQIVNEESGVVLETLSSLDGLYRATSLPSGTYRIEAYKEGFEQLVRQGLVVTTGQVISVDLTLNVGASSDVVVVEGGAPLTETQSASTGQLVNRRMVASLPMPNRAASALVALAPGVVMIQTGQGAENYPLFSISGGRARNQQFLLDGGNATNASGLTRPQQMTSLPMDAMEEFRVIANNYSAEYGHSAGGVITMTTRSGTNELHGSVFEFLRNNALDARNFFAKEKPPLSLNQFGAAVGGPIQRDKAHFFVSWERTQQVSSETPLLTVPSIAQLSGDFSELRNAAGNPLVVFDPLTTIGQSRQPFANNLIPINRFDGVALAALNYWPIANRQGTHSGANNFSANSNSELARNIVTARVDYQAGYNDRFTGRYYINDASIENYGSYGIAVSDPSANFTDVRVQSILGGYTHVFSPTLFNDLKVSFFQRKFIDRRFGWETDLAGAIGLNGVSATSFPTFQLPGYAALGGTPGRTQTPIRDTQILEDVSWFKGNHSLKFGFEHRRAANNEVRDRASSGSFQFVPQFTGLPELPESGDALASFLLGEVNSANVLVSDLIQSRAYYLAGYVQDTWQFNDRLTLNLGVRWETELPRRVVDDSQNSFDTARINPVSGTPGVVTFAGRDGVMRQAFRTDWNNLGPRIGLAYRLPTRRETVVRAGGGFFYGSTVSNTIGDTASTGFSTAASLVVPQASFLSAMRLRDGFPEIVRQPLDAGFGAVPHGQRPYTSVGFFRQDQVAPISYQYNLNIQREVATETVIEIGYVGNVSHHLTANDFSLNQVPVEKMGPGDAQAQRPYPQFSDVYWINPSIGNSSYHGAYLRIERRFEKGVSLLAHYTFSKFLDDVASSDELGDPGSYMNAYQRGLDKSLSGTDVPHRLVLTGLYETPSLAGHLRFVRWIVGDWRLGILTTLQSGAPFTVTTAANRTNAFSAGPLRPNLLHDPRLEGRERTLSRWFDTGAFIAPGEFEFGDSPRSVLRGDSLQTVDVTVAKDVPINERFRMDLRGEFYNVLNHANFGLPGHVLGTSSFGSVLSAEGSRTIQLGLRLSF